jgi:hypothetical protein
MRSIGAWERGESEPRGRPRWELQQLLAKAENEGVTRAPDPPAAPTIREASDTELLLELLRRAAQKETP